MVEELPGRTSSVMASNDATGTATFELLKRVYGLAVEPERIDELVDYWSHRIELSNQKTPTAGAFPEHLGAQQLEVLREILRRALHQKDFGASAQSWVEHKEHAAFVLDRTGRVVAANSAAPIRLGVCIGDDVRDRVVSDDADCAVLVGALVNGNKVTRVARLVSKHNNEAFYVSASEVVGLGEDFVAIVTSAVDWPESMTKILATSFSITAAEAAVLKSLTLNTRWRDASRAGRCKGHLVCWSLAADTIRFFDLRQTLAIRRANISVRLRAADWRARRIARLKRDHQKRVNLPRVENDESLPKHKRAAFACQNVKTASTRENRRCSFRHSPHHTKGATHRHVRAVLRLHPQSAGHVAIDMRLVNVRHAKRRDPILHHAAAVTVDHRQWHASIVVFACCDAIGCIGGKKRGPVLEATVVETFRIASVEIRDLEAQCWRQIWSYARHDRSPGVMQSVQPFQNPRTAASVTRDPSIGSMPVPPICITVRASGSA